MDHHKLPKALEAELSRFAQCSSYLPCVEVASNYQLSRPSHVNRLAIAVLALGIPRRRLAYWVATTIALYKGKIVWASGVEFKFDEDAIDDAFELEKDPSQRWVGDFYKFAARPPKQMAQDRVIERLRWIDLAFRIAYPERAELIAA